MRKLLQNKQVRILLFLGVIAFALLRSEIFTNKKPTDKVEQLRLENYIQPLPGNSAPPTPRRVSMEDNWTKLTGCTLIKHQYNDGDNVVAKHLDEDGSSFTETSFRFYFVDAPESRDKPFADHRERVNEQGEELGGLDYLETIELGQLAKISVRELLEERSFTVWTRWEEVYDSSRYYALIEVEGKAGAKWLHRALVRAGLARVHTKGIDLPDGTTRQEEEAQLEDWQEQIQRQHKLDS